MYRCSAVLCKSTKISGNSIFKFPTEMNEYLLWAKMCGRPDLIDKFIPDTSKNNQKFWLCEKHFQKSDIIQGNRKHLKKNAVPTLNIEVNAKEGASNTSEIDFISIEEDTTDLEVTHITTCEVSCGKMIHSCEICFEFFHKTKRIPKVLECGHTFCLLCLKNLIDSQYNCPVCQIPLTKAAEDYPTNFAVLKEDTEPASKYCACVLKDLYKKFEIHLSTIDKDISKKNEMKKKIEDNLSKIKSFLKMDQDSINVEEVEKLAANLRLEMKFNKDPHRRFKISQKSTYNFNNYENPDFFILDLAIHLQKGQGIFVYGTLENFEIKLCKIIMDDNKICLPVLSLLAVDVDDKGSVASVSFQDFKKCMTSENFRAFIEVDNQKLYFQMVNSSVLALQFIKLCTGETGSSFLGITVKMSPQSSVNDMIIENCQANDNKTQNVSDYNLSLFSDEREIICYKGEIVVHMTSKGWEIQKCSLKEHIYKNVVAKMDVNNVMSFNSIDSCKQHVISNCGIAFDLSAQENPYYALSKETKNSSDQKRESEKPNNILEKIIKSWIPNNVINISAGLKDLNKLKVSFSNLICGMLLITNILIGRMLQTEIQSGAEVGKQIENKLNDHLKEIPKDFQNIQERLLEKWIGPNYDLNQFERLCYEYSDEWYTYKLCPFHGVEQITKNRNKITHLGSLSWFAGFEGNKFSIIKYTGGEECLDGYRRSAEVRFSCGIKNEITSVTEAEMCEYKLLFSSPAACD